MQRVEAWLLQVASLTPKDQILVVGHSAEPQACVKADQTALTDFFSMRTYIPLPDYAARRVNQPMSSWKEISLEREKWMGCGGGGGRQDAIALCECTG